MTLPVDIEKLLGQEDGRVEWKENVADSEAVVKTLVAFANDHPKTSDGGWVLCGIREERDDHGFPLPRPVGLPASRFKEVEGKVLDACRRHVSPPLLPTVYEERLPEDASRRILVFFVETSPDVHAFSTKTGGSRYWIRHHNRTVEARGDLLHKLLQGKGELPPYLDRPCQEAALEDLNLVAAEEFLREARLPRPPAEYLQPNTVIDALARPLVLSKTVAPDTSRSVPTYLALLLFGREPSRFMPGAYVVFSVYEGVKKTEIHSQRFETTGPLPKIFRDLLEKLRLYTGLQIDKSASALEGPQNRLRYSEKALQEAIINAFAHRDYESRDPTRITVFSDRIEIMSPGGYVPGMDPQRLKEGTAAVRWRNPALASFLVRMGLAQHEGQGIPTIIEETVAVAGQRPQIIPQQGTFEIVLPAFQPIRPSAPDYSQTANGTSGKDGLILVAIGAKSIRPVVESSLEDLGLGGAEVLVDHVIDNYVSPDPQHWLAEAKRIRNEVREWVEDPRYARLHLFYRGPVVMAPLLGALISKAKPLVVYHHQNGRYGPAYTLEKELLISKT